MLSRRVQWSCNAVERVEGRQTDVASIWYNEPACPSCLRSFLGSQSCRVLEPVLIQCIVCRWSLWNVVALLFLLSWTMWPTFSHLIGCKTSFLDVLPANQFSCEFLFSGSEDHEFLGSVWSESIATSQEVASLTREFTISSGTSICCWVTNSSI